MIKALLPALFSASDYNKYCNEKFSEAFNLIDLKINENANILTSYYACADEECGFIDAKVSHDVFHGDTLVMFISGENNNVLPRDFKKILEASDHSGEINLIAGYKIWQNGDPLKYRISHLQGETFINLISISGTHHIVDAKGRINNSCSDIEIVTPRAYTKNGGYILSAFAYDENNIKVKEDQNVLASIHSGRMGLSVGVASTDGGMSKRMKAISEAKCGGLDDIAFCIAFD